MISDADSIDVLIVGGGASAVAVLSVIAKSNQQLSVVVAEKSSAVGVGIAYATELEHHLLNVPAQAMGIDSAQPADFLNWAMSNNLPIKGSDFVSRMTYGRYLRDILQRVLADGRVQIWQSEVVSLKRDGTLFNARGADGKQILTKNVILAIGHTALELPIKKISAAPADRLIQNPWRMSGYERLENIEHIAILGTGLTAMDVVAAIDQRGFRGQITLISRRGLIPFASHGEAELKEVVLTEETLRLPLRALVAWIRSEAENMVSKQYDWRALIDALRPHIPCLWRRLSERERSQFLRHLRPYWEVVRHRMPSLIRARVDELRAEHRLHILRARVSELSADVSGLLHLKLKTMTEERQITVDRLFNCTGGSALKLGKLPELLTSLQQQGLIALDSFGLGVKTGPCGELLNSQENIVAGCFVIGPLRRASDWESTAMREIREQAQKIVHEIKKTNLGGSSNNSIFNTGVNTRSCTNICINNYWRSGVSTDTFTRLKEK